MSWFYKYSLIVSCRSIPSLYIHALRCYIDEKVAFLAELKNPPPKSQSTLYNYQSLYIKGLIAQIPSDVILGASSRPVLLHPPITVQHKVLRQGPFLLQPSPRILEGGEAGDATDIVYLAFCGEDDDGLDGELEGATQGLGVVLIAYQDGKVDVCLDVQKAEAAWETRSVCYSSILSILMVAHYHWTMSVRTRLADACCIRNDRSGVNIDIEISLRIDTWFFHVRAPPRQFSSFPHGSYS